MGQRTEEQLTSDIETTRRDLTRDVDALSERVSPHAVMERRKAATRGRLRSMKERVMGSAQDTRQGARSTADRMESAASEVASSVSHSAQDATRTVEQKAEGNPLAAGVIAFGAGWLVSSLLPASSQETEASRRMMDTAKRHGDPLLDEARSAGREVGSRLQSEAEQAAQEVKASARQSAQHVKEEGTSSARHVQEDARRQT